MRTTIGTRDGENGIWVEAKDGALIVSLVDDDLTIGDRYSADEAASAFWKALRRLQAMAATDALRAYDKNLPDRMWQIERNARRR